MIVRAKRYGAAQDYTDMDVFEIDEDMEHMTKALPVMERAVAARSRHGLAPILEPDEDYDDFDASAFLERSYQ
jgi:hypothetical protein